MGMAWRRSVAKWCALAALLCPLAAHADAPLALYRTFTGHVNFTGAEETMRGGASDCSMEPDYRDQVLQVRNIPSGSTIVSAQLYWAGSGTSAVADYTVNFNGTDVTAPSSPSRRYFSHTIGSGYDYFGGAADVTSLVGPYNADYHAHGLTVSHNAPWCGGLGVLGGFALLVVYSNPNEPFRVVDVYEGFEYLRYNSIALTANNFKIPYWHSDGHVGYLAWLGDSGIRPYEQVAWNGDELYDWTNPSGNQFNSASSMGYGGDSYSWGIDFDDYTVSACTCQAGQTSGTLKLKTWSDTILVQNAVIAMPSMPTADLKISMVRNGELQVGGSTSYTVTVASAGPDPEAGPVTVIDTLPSGLQYVSAAGTGWSCSPSGQLVSCSHAGPLASGASFPVLILTVRATASGTWTNSAAVSGQDYDYVSSNNSARDTASTPGSFVFTDAPCVAGKAFGAPGQTCQRYTGPALAGAASAIYVTAIDNNLNPVAVNTFASSTVSVRFALACVNPPAGAGVLASYAGAALPPCAPNGAIPDPAGAGWSGTVTLTFAANSPSAQLGAGFFYEDIGQVVFSLADAGNKVSSASFVVKPARLAFVSITRTSDGAPNPAAANGSGTGFARAGEAFTMKVAALTANGKQAPNFGNAGAQVALAQQAQGNLPPVRGSFDTLAAGVFSGAGFAWDEAGIVVLTPTLAGNDYLGAGDVPGDPANVGRFYPDHFETAVSAAFPCQPRMACPSGTSASGDLLDVSGGAYSGQPFMVTVRAIGAAGNTLTNYNGQYARPITLSAWDAPAGSGANPGGGSIAANTIGAIAAGEDASASPSYQLPVTWSASAPRALDWSAPTAIYLRATAADSIAAAGGGTQAASISSKRASGTVEGGVSVVGGRLYVANAFGSELLKLSLGLGAQYWTGTLWDANLGDNASAIVSGATFSQCQKNLANGGAGAYNCKGALALAGGGQVLSGGKATAWLAAPGAGNDGSGYVLISNSAAPWLPSTLARAVFGIYRSRLLYLREVY